MISFSFILVIITVCVSSKNCVLKYANFPANNPVFLFKGQDLIEPKNLGIVLQTGDNISIICPGAKNELTAVRGNPVRATCLEQNTLQVEVGSKNVEKNLMELGCSTPVTGDVQRTTKKCGNGGRIIHIGHKIENQFLTLINVCYDDVKEEALYAEHVIYGSAINYSGSIGKRLSFKVGGLAALNNPSKYYGKASQMQTFASILGTACLAKQYFASNSFLVRGHLAPIKDQIYVSSQRATNFFINAVPQWQQINNGNWKSLENSLRKVAAASGENFRVITGVHKILALQDTNGQLSDIYLADNKLPVPKFIWKVFYSRTNRKGIAFVSINNPFITEITKKHILCKDICNNYGWGTKSWQVPSKGFLYCCEIDDLRKSVPNIPKLDVSGGVQEKNSSERSSKMF